VYTLPLGQRYYGTLKVYEKFPHGMCTTHADVINADLLAFLKS
jgi:non-heme chloroperoxidase